MVFILLKNLEARYTVSGTNSCTKLRYTSSFCGDGEQASNLGLYGLTYAFAVGVVECFQLYNIGVSHNPHDLEFTVLQPG